MELMFQVAGRLDALADINDMSDAMLMEKLRELQSDTIARLRTTYDIQTCAEGEEDQVGTTVSS